MNGQAQQQQTLDPALEEMLKRASEVEEADEEIGRPELPRSDYLVGYLSTAEFREVDFGKPENGSIPAVRIGITVTEGVTAAVGKTYYDDLFLGTGELVPVEKGSDEMRPATTEEIKERQDKVIATCKKFARVFELDSFLPTERTEEGIQAWLGHLTEAGENGPTVIFSGYGRNGFSHILWLSLRKPDDVGKDPKTKKPTPGTTALEIARKMITKAGGVTGDGGNGNVY